MNKPVMAAYAVAAVVLGTLVWSFVPAPLPLNEDIRIEPITPPRVEGVRLSAIPSGSMQALEAFAYRGGSPLRTVEFAVGAILVRHPDGNLLFDTGFGRDVAQHVDSMPALMRAMTSYEAGRPVAQQLVEGGVPLEEITRVVLTHAHWDHVSGLPDFPGVQIMASQAEAAFIEGDDPAAALVRSFGFLPIGPFHYRDVPYLGFAQSFDVFGDGSVVMVPVPGHTPGSTLTFVHTGDGKHYALLGDLVWYREGITQRAERPLLSRWMADHDARAVREQIVHLHRLQKLMPELVMVPAHDPRVWNTLPRFPD